MNLNANFLELSMRKPDFSNNMRDTTSDAPVAML